MSFYGSMQRRYTTKVYDNSAKLDPAQIDELKEILRLCPSSINSQPWKFIFVSDDEVKENLAKASRHNDNKVLNCDTLVVFCSIDNVELFENIMKRDLSQGSIDYYYEHIRPLPEASIKEWFHNQVYLASGVFLSACAEMGIDSTAMEGIELEDYDKILELKDYRTLLAMAIGHRDPDDFNQPAKKPKTRRHKDEIILSM